MMIVFLLGCLATIVLSIWTKPKHRWMVWVIGVVAVACQVWAWVDQEGTQKRLEDNVTAARTSLAVADARVQDLQKKTDLSITLLAKTSKSVSDQELRRQINEAIFSNKLDRISNNTDTKKSEDVLSRTPEERIAGVLERVERGTLQDVELEMKRGKSAKELILDYYEAVAKIPAFYTKDDWGHAENIIVTDMLSRVRGNLEKRGVYSSERYGAITQLLQDERVRYAAAREKFNAAKQ